jgi:hypothetical protein
VAIRATEHFIAWFQQAWETIYVDKKLASKRRFKQCFDVRTRPALKSNALWFASCTTTMAGNVFQSIGDRLTACES